MSEGYISEVGIDVEDLPQTTNEEELAAIEQSFDNLTSKRFDKKVELTLEQIEEVRQELRDKEDELEDLLNGKNLDDNDERRIEEALEEIEEMMEALDEFKDNFSEFVDDRKEWNLAHFRKAMGEDLMVENIETGSPEDLEKNTYTYDLGNQFSNIFGGTSESDHDYLVENGITNARGEVIKDVLPDGKLNQDDISAALKEKNDPLAAQNVMVRLSPGQFLTSHIYDPVSGDVTFTVTDEEGYISNLIYRGVGSANFQFSSGITEAFAATLTPELQKICYMAEDEKSFYEHINPSEDLPIEVQNGVIKGYKAVTDNLSAAIARTSGGADQAVVRKVIDSLFGYINDSTADNIGDVWAEIQSQLTDAGITDPAQRSRILQAVIFAVAENASQHFATFFGPVIGLLEGVLEGEMADNVDNLTSGAKLAIMLLEIKGGGAVGNYGGPELFSLYFPSLLTDPPAFTGWKDKDSMLVALRGYRDIVGRMDGVMGGEVGKLIKLLVDSPVQTTADGASILGTPGTVEGVLDHSPDYKSASMEYEHWHAEAVSSAEVIDDGPAEYGGTADFDDDEWLILVDGLATKLFNEDGSMVDDPWDAIKNVHQADDDGIDDLEDTDMDDLICALIVFINDNFSEEFKTAFFTRIKASAIAYLDEDNDAVTESAGSYEPNARRILNRYTESNSAVENAGGSFD